MLTSLARASLRRVVSLPLRPLTAPVAARAVLLAPAVRTQQPFGTTSWAHEAAKGKSTKGAASKKKKTTKAAATKAKAKPKAKPKPKPKPKKKKVLTPEEKAKKEVRELKVAALLNEPAKLPGTSWLVYVTQELKGKSVGGDLAGRTRAVREAFRSLSSYELERLQETAESNRQANIDAYKTWVESHSAEEIYKANLARGRLSRKYNKSHRKITDERLPKRPLTAYSLFVKARWASGDVSNVASTAAGAARILADEWKALPESEKKPYLDQAAADAARYAEEKKEFSD
ncbi:hypothetical protein SAPIO_CDS3132 [Scedosporium apiospermum]|uniref:HMG box domain-containing protein n=1 Tax=Pseudallescheria apiosperma TaxID=563466 RepID=A0A084GA38_PSEDA|nr:uncharacterized protein SAPIO_CDS3132 [Scedosporium apiospermum]KEZ44200.1 hypothetical protein SAPIO_CDS3132 [Scedosporium apiospermum]